MNFIVREKEIYLWCWILTTRTANLEKYGKKTKQISWKMNYWLYLSFLKAAILNCPWTGKIKKAISQNTFLA